MAEGKNESYKIFAAKNNESIACKDLRCNFSTTHWKYNSSKCSFWKIRKIDTMSICSMPDVSKGLTE